MIVAVSTPSLTLPLSGGGDLLRGMVRKAFTSGEADYPRYGSAFPPPARGRVREGVISGFRDENQRARANLLRREMTEAEKRLWYHLRAHRFLGVSVRRQAPVGPYIVDFLIPSRRIILEVDGGQHADTARDAVRDAYLADRGYHVLRVWNHDVMTNLSGVLDMLSRELRR